MSDQPAVRYTVQPLPVKHLFRLSCRVEMPEPTGQTVALAAWIPGSYMIRDFAKHVIEMRAESNAGPLPLRKLDKQTWRAEPAEGPVTFHYEVYAWDLSVRGAHLDQTHGYFNGTSLFLQVHGKEGLPTAVELLPPEGEAFGDWRVATTLPAAGAPDHGFGPYRAGDYEELVDHPVEMGRFTLVRFEACGVPHEMAITGRHNADTSRLARDLKRLCEHHIRFFGEPAPMERYLFQVTAVGDGYGGLEHRSSTSLLCKRDDLPRPAEPEVDEGYRSFLGLCSHEYFHTWNIKRIKPTVFQPYDLRGEVHTPLLWAFEGITSYYDDLALVRTGLIEVESYLELLGQTITRLLRTPGRFRQSVSESSFDAWTKFYKQDENAANAIVSYYIKGAVIALALDLQMRRGSDGSRSLDDLMRVLWERHGRPGLGVTETGLEALVSEVAGFDLSGFLEGALRGREDPPLAELLAPFGVRFHTRPAESARDKGGKPAKGGERARVSLGITTAEDPLGAKAGIVFENGPAQQAGISPGDILVAIDGLRATHASLERRLAAFRPGDRVEVHAFRRDELMRFALTLTAPPSDTCFLTLAEDADPQMRRLRQGWLGG